MAAANNTNNRRHRNGRRALPLLQALLLLLLAAAATTTVQAFVVAPALRRVVDRSVGICAGLTVGACRSRSEGATIAMSMGARGALESRRESLQREGAIGAMALVLGRPGAVRAAAAGGDPKEAMKRVIVVRDSTEQLRADLENGTGAEDPDVRALVTSLLRNYRLKESLEAALALGAFGSDAAREAAAGHGKLGVENLAIIIEYFPEAQEGPIKNKIKLRPDELQFTLKALEAAGKELSAFLKAFPAGVVDGLRQEMNSA